MEAIVLAGGFGTRLRQLVADVPKPMAPVAGRPFLEIVLLALQRQGVNRTVLSVGYMADKIIDHFGDQFGTMQIIYEVERQPLGTGGAVLAALGRCHDDHALVLNGDTFVDVDLATLRSAWRAHRVPIIVARQVADTSRYGRLALNGQRVVGFAEKGVGGAGLINAGAYVLPVDLFGSSPPAVPFSLEADFLAPSMARRRFDVFVTAGEFIDIGVPEDYLRAQTMLFGV